MRKSQKVLQRTDVVAQVVAGWLGSGLAGKVKFGRDGRHAGAATTTLTSVAFLVIWNMLGAFALFPRTTHGAQRPPLWGVTCLRPSCKREE